MVNFLLPLKQSSLHQFFPLLAIYQENIKKTAYMGCLFCVKVFYAAFSSGFLTLQFISLSTFHLEVRRILVVEKIEFNL